MKKLALSKRLQRFFAHANTKWLVLYVKMRLHRDNWYLAMQYGHALEHAFYMDHTKNK
jgi:hypothetical protein